MVTLTDNKIIIEIESSSPMEDLINFRKGLTFMLISQDYRSANNEAEHSTLKLIQEIEFNPKEISFNKNQSNN